MKERFIQLRKSFRASIAELRRFDWNDLGDLDSIGVWPGPVKLVLALVVFAACLGGGYWFHIKPLQEDLARVTRQEEGLRNDLRTKAVLAANLDVYRRQMQVMEESFGELLAQLPGQTEVPGLLEDITFTGLGSGLEFSSIQLQDEVTREFYVELPINITVAGTYHDFGAFVSGVSSLSRIVTLHDFSIRAGDNRGVLNMTVTARTYRYISEEE